MIRRFLVASTLAWMTAAVVAQGERPVQWISNAQQGVAQAKRSGMPLLFYIGGSGSSGRSDSDLEDAQQQTLRDGLVRGIVQSRFVPVRLPRSTNTQTILNQMGARVGVGYCLVVATPDGELIGVIDPQQLTDARTLARQLTAMFRKYRTQVFEKELKPKLEGGSAGEIIKALKVIDAMLITEADTSVVALVEKGGLSPAVTKQAYSTLATLSTPAAVKALLKAALQDKLAARALNRCTAGGAAELLPALDSQNFDEFLVAYEAMTKICKINNAKPRGFWSGKNERLIQSELERVKAEVQKSSKLWRERYEAYR